MEYAYIRVDFDSSLDEESVFIFLNATITLNNIETNNLITIGYANFHLINVNLYKDWDSVVYHADSIDGDIYSITEGLGEVIVNEIDFMGLLVVMDKIKIDKEYRRQGYATEAIEEIVKYFETWSCDYFALRPFPFEEENKQIQRDMVPILINFYKKFKFEIVQEDSDTELILGRNLNYL